MCFLQYQYANIEKSVSKVSVGTQNKAQSTKSRASSRPHTVMLTDAAAQTGDCFEVVLSGALVASYLMIIIIY